jgi:protein O-mannosyl-transferase
MVFNILCRYLLLLVFPLRLSYDYSYNQIPFVGWEDVWAIISIAAYIAMSLYVINGFVHRDQRSFGVAYYLITLSLVSNLFFLIGSTMAERFLFTPSLGFCYTFGLFGAHINRLVFGSVSDQRMSWIVPATFIICIVLSIRTIDREADWKDNLTLLTTDVISSPNSARVQSSLGEKYMKLGKNLQKGNQQTELLQKAVVHFRKSLEILPAQWEVWHNLGYTYLTAGEYNEALKDFQRALECEPNSAMVHSSLSETYMRLGKNLQKGDQQTELLQKAIVHFRKSLKILPTKWSLWQGLGYTYYLAGNYDEALKNFQCALKCDPNISITYVNIGVIAFLRKEYGQAIEFFKIAVKLDSSNAIAHLNLGTLY